MTEPLVLVGDYPPPSGGIAIHVQALAALAREAGLQVQVLNLGKGRRRAPREPGVIQVGGPADLLRRLARAIASGARLHVHVSGNNRKAWLLALAATAVHRPGGPRPLLTIHSGLAPDFLAGSIAHRRLARAAAAGCEQVLCANHEISAALAAAGVPSGKLEILPAFIAAAVRPGAAPAAAVDAARTRRPFLLAALAPGRQYGEAVLLEALALLREAHPHLVCAVVGPGTSSAELLARAGAAGAAELLLPLGELPHPAVLGTLQLADCFVRPTLADGDSISVREALTLGVRVVASDVGHRPPAATLFRAGDPAQLAAKVEAALAGPPPGEGAAGADAAPRILRLWHAPSVQAVAEGAPP